MDFKGLLSDQFSRSPSRNSDPGARHRRLFACQPSRKLLSWLLSAKKIVRRSLHAQLLNMVIAVRLVPVGDADVSGVTFKV